MATKFRITPTNCPDIAHLDYMGGKVAIPAEVAEEILSLDRQGRGLFDMQEAAKIGFNFAAFCDDKTRWSIETFGPAKRTAGVLAHIRKELDEIEREPGDLEEWCDLIILALDGAARSAGADGQAIVDALVAKMAKNKARTWPDWRTMPEDAAIEHVRGPAAPSPRYIVVRRDEVNGRPADVRPYLFDAHDHAAACNDGVLKFEPDAEQYFSASQYPYAVVDTLPEEPK